MKCFSSSCAMAAKFWIPELEFNEYHQKRPQFGDSTDTIVAWSPLACLLDLMSWLGRKLKAQLDRGRPAGGIPAPRHMECTKRQGPLRPGDRLHR